MGAFDVQTDGGGQPAVAVVAVTEALHDALIHFLRQGFGYLLKQGFDRIDMVVHRATGYAGLFGQFPHADLGNAFFSKQAQRGAINTTLRRG